MPSFPIGFLGISLGGTSSRARHLLKCTSDAPALRPSDPAAPRPSDAPTLGLALPGTRWGPLRKHDFSEIHSIWSGNPHSEWKGFLKNVFPKRYPSDFAGVPLRKHDSWGIHAIRSGNSQSKWTGFLKNDVCVCVSKRVP